MELPYCVFGHFPAENHYGIAGPVPENAINAMVITTYGLPCPVVAAITGHAIAGGFILALCADYRIASAQGRYGVTEVQVGMLRGGVLAEMRSAAQADPRSHRPFRSGTNASRRSRPSATR